MTKNVSDSIAAQMSATLNSNEHQSLFGIKTAQADTLRCKYCGQPAVLGACNKDGCPGNPNKPNKADDANYANDSPTACEKCKSLGKKECVAECPNKATLKADDNNAKDSSESTSDSSDCMPADDSVVTAFDVAIDSLLTASAALDAVGLGRGSAMSLKMASLVVEAKKADKKKKEKSSTKKKEEKSSTKKKDDKSSSKKGKFPFKKTVKKAGKGFFDPDHDDDEDPVPELDFDSPETARTDGAPEDPYSEIDSDLPDVDDEFEDIDGDDEFESATFSPRQEAQRGRFAKYIERKLDDGVVSPEFADAFLAAIVYKDEVRHRLTELGECKKKYNLPDEECEKFRDLLKEYNRVLV
jgi:hypothetical protein